MRIIRPGEKLTGEELRSFAKMAGRAYLDDPVHRYATKNPKRREQFVYHFMMERLNTSNGTDYFYIDDEGRGICVWRKAHNEYGVLDFLKCPDWLYLYWFWPNTLRTLSAYGPLDVKAFSEDTWIISPVFVDPAHQGKGLGVPVLALPQLEHQLRIVAAAGQMDPAQALDCQGDVLTAYEDFAEVLV